MPGDPAREQGERTHACQLRALDLTTAVSRTHVMPLSSGMGTFGNHYRRVKGRSHSVEEQLSTQSQKRHATSKPSLHSPTHSLTAPSWSCWLYRGGVWGSSDDGWMAGCMRVLQVCADFLFHPVASPVHSFVTTPSWVRPACCPMWVHGTMYQHPVSRVSLFVLAVIACKCKCKCKC